MNMEYFLAKRVYKLNIVYTLVSKVRRIVIESKVWMVFKSLQCSLRRYNIECNFSRVCFQGKFYSEFLILVHYWQPPRCKIVISLVYHLRSNRRKRIKQ